MRDRLIKLIAEVQYMGGLEEKLADHLINNGVLAVDFGVVSPRNRPLISQCFGRPLDEVLDLIRTKQEWISVDDRLPDKELNEFRNGNENLLYPCLVFIKHSFLSNGYINKAWYMGSKFVEQNTDDITEVVTHWMPLPEPPKKGGAE